MEDVLVYVRLDWCSAYADCCNFYVLNMVSISIWRSSVYPGLNLEFGKRPTWIMLPFLTICIIPDSNRKDETYVPDYYRLKKTFGKWKIYQHYEPEHNINYFCFGFNSDSFYFGSYILTKRKRKDNLPILYDLKDFEQAAEHLVVFHPELSPN